MPPRKKGKLTDLQRRFAIEYALDHVAVRAAIRAGCSPASARTTAWQWMNWPEYAHVRELCDQILDDRLADVQTVRRSQYRELDLLTRARPVATGLKIKEALENAELVKEARTEAAETGRHYIEILLEMVLDETELAAVTITSISYFQGGDGQGQGVTLKFKAWNKPQCISTMLKYYGQVPEKAPEDDEDAQREFEKSYREAQRNFEVEDDLADESPDEPEAPAVAA
jgi:hypothetical protein